MRRILLFIDSLGAGGAQRQLVGLAVMLKQRGFITKVVTYYNHPFYKYILDENNCDYECLNVNSKFCLPKLVRCIKLFKADVLISYQTDPNALACIAAAMTRTKLIVSERNTHLSISFKDRIIFQLYRYANRIVPNSYSEGQFICGKFAFLASKVVVISNFVDLRLFTPCNNKVLSVKKKILIVASVKASKNTKNFIYAINLAKKRGCKIHITWYGVNPANSDLRENVQYANECMELVRKLGLDNELKLLPKRQDIQNAYREADIFCLPSFFEGTPNVICEAMASGLPVIASRVCDNSCYIKDGYNGILFNPNDIESIADAIIRLVNMAAEDLLLWGQRSRSLVEKLCSEVTFINKYIDLIDSI